MDIKRNAPDNEGTPSNCSQFKDSQKTLTHQDIANLKQTQQRKLMIALSEANCARNMRQLAIITSIDRSTICRRLDELQKRGLVVLTHYAPCPISKYPTVGFYAEGGQDNEHDNI